MEEEVESDEDGGSSSLERGRKWREMKMEARAV